MCSTFALKMPLPYHDSLRPCLASVDVVSLRRAILVILEWISSDGGKVVGDDVLLSEKCSSMTIGALNNNTSFVCHTGTH